jgi:hypothetical protein
MWDARFFLSSEAKSRFISKANGSLLKSKMNAPQSEIQVRGFPPLRRKEAARMGHGAELAVF